MAKNDDMPLEVTAETPVNLGSSLPNPFGYIKNPVGEAVKSGWDSFMVNIGSIESAIVKEAQSLAGIGAKVRTAETLPSNSVLSSLSSKYKGFMGTTTGKVAKVGGQVAIASAPFIALPALSVYSVDSATQGLQDKVDNLTGIKGAGSILPLGILLFVGIIILFLLVRKL